jgi:hypothetical protein
MTEHDAEEREAEELEPEVSPNDPAQPPNAPEQHHAGFAEGEATPEAFPADQEVGRFSTGQDAGEPIERGSFAQGQEELPDPADPDEGYAEEERESSPTGTQGQDDVG